MGSFWQQSKAHRWIEARRSSGLAPDNFNWFCQSGSPTRRPKMAFVSVGHTFLSFLMLSHTNISLINEKKLVSTVSTKRRMLPILRTSKEGKNKKSSSPRKSALFRPERIANSRRTHSAIINNQTKCKYKFRSEKAASHSRELPGAVTSWLDWTGCCRT